MSEKILAFLNMYGLKKIIPFIIFGIWLFFIINNTALYTLNWDECYSVYISRIMSFQRIIELMKFEGHTFIWYILLKSFSGAGLYTYPVILKGLNLLFSTGYYFVFWRFAPFKPVYKILFLFTVPMLKIFPVLARCYSIGIFSLFLLCAMYKKRLKHPVIYSILILITANTSLMAAIGAGALGILFLYDLFKSVQKRDIIISVSIALFCIYLLYIQWFGFVLPQQTTDYDNKAELLFFFFNTRTIPWNYKILSTCENIRTAFMIIITPFAYILPGILFFKKKRVLFFYSATLISLCTFFLLIYSGNYYHKVFIFIYLIISFWLYKCETEGEDIGHSLFEKIVRIIVCILMLLYITLNVYKIPYVYWGHNIKDMREKIEYIDSCTGKDAVLYLQNPMHLLSMDSVYLKSKVYVFNEDVPVNKLPDNSYLLAEKKFVETVKIPVTKEISCFDEYNLCLFKLKPVAE